jgi:L-iditol 2-dehydrogenase
VEEVGAGVEAYHPGDRLALAADVYCDECWYCRHELFNMCDRLKILGKHMDGGMTDCFLLQPEILEHGTVNRLPPGLSLLHAAVSEPLCSVLASHDALAIESGETVVVLGSGPMGILHLELLRIRGARVIMADFSDERLRRAHVDFDAEYTLDASGSEVRERVRELTSGLGADIVITAAPSGEAISSVIGIVRRCGRIGVFSGLPLAQASVAIDMNLVHYSEIRLVGNFSYHPRYHRRALELLASSAVRCDKLITTYPLADTRRALHDIREGKVLKAVITPNGGLLV